jgi:NADPH-dependent ferric siderophore reductase
VQLAAPELAEFGVDGPLLDQRIKLVFPHESGGLCNAAEAEPDWLRTWMERPVAERGHMRTYTVREVRGAGADTRVVVDFVVHEDSGGPGSGWAAGAQPGDRVVMVAPRRGCPFGGIEFDPGSAERVLLVADETAVPAVAGILDGLPPSAVGTALLEVPEDSDMQQLSGPEGVRVVWLPREQSARGEQVTRAVLDELAVPVGPGEVDDSEVDPDLWETPHYSSSGAPLEEDQPPAYPGLYAWIAGESRVVTALRRTLVNEVGLARRQVAFMGYWREGVAMRS